MTSATMSDKEQFVVCAYDDHGYSYQPMAIFDDYDSAKPFMRDLTKRGKHVEVWAFTGPTEKRRVTQWHAQDVKREGGQRIGSQG